MSDHAGTVGKIVHRRRWLRDSSPVSLPGRRLPGEGDERTGCRSVLCCSGPVCTVDDITVTGAAGSKPTITIPDTWLPAEELLSKDLVVGTGPR